MDGIGDRSNREVCINNLKSFSASNVNILNAGNVDMTNMGSINISGNFTAKNAGVVNIDGSGDVSIGGSLSISDSEEFVFANVGRDNPNGAGFKVQHDVNASNLNKFLCWYANSVQIGGNLNISDVQYFQMDRIGVSSGGDFYTNDNYGFEVAGDMNLTRVGNADNEDAIVCGWDASFLKVGGSLTIKDMGDNMQFTQIGRWGGGSRGIEIGKNFVIDNRGSKSLFDAGFHDSNYMTVGNDINLHNVKLLGWGMDHVEIGGDVFVGSNASMFFDRIKDYFKVMGDLTVEGDQFENRDAGYAYIGGDLNVRSGDVKFGNHKGKDGAAVSLTNVGLEIGGTINMGGGKLGLVHASINGPAPTSDSELFVSASGIDGFGMIYMAEEHKTTEFNLDTTLILNNTKDCAFMGSITYYSAFEGYDKMALNIIKNGAGSQTIIVNDGDSPDPALLSKWRGKVTVNEGTMAIYTGESSSAKIDLELNGGALAVAYSKLGKYNPAEDIMGIIRAGTIEIKGDTDIVFDIVNNPYMGYENDLIEADIVSGDGIATIVVELDADTFSEGDTLDNVEFALFRVAENNYDWAKALVRGMYKGTDITETLAKIEASFSGDKSGSLSVIIDGVVVPEPASVAAVFGALALGLAAYRRRK